MSSTFSDNTGGSIYTEAYLDTRLAVRNSTLAGGALLSNDTDTVFANSAVGVVVCQGFGGNVISTPNAGYNVFGFMFGNPAPCTLDSTDILLDGAFALDPLANNGGPTLTRSLPVGSPLIDGGDPAGCKDTDLTTALTTGQHGQPRNDGSCDIGAFEVQ